MQASITRRYRSLLKTATVVLLALLPLGTGACGNGSEPQFSSEVQEKFAKAVDDKMAEYGVPGAIVGVWIPGEGEWLSVRGKADLQTGAVPKLTDSVRAGSITKTFTATTILQMVDDKKLSLSDTLADLKLGVKVPNADRITVRNLLNMTSGLCNFTANPKFWTDFYANPARPWTPEELVALTEGCTPPDEPGSKYDYNNTNYILLGLIIEKRSGRPAWEEITRRTIDRLGLRNTRFPMGPEMPEPFLHGYTTTLDNSSTTDIKSLNDISVHSPTAWWTAGAIISNLHDLKTWLKALSEGSLLSPEMHAEQLKFSAPNTTNYGLGIMNGGTFIGHSGEVPGYNSSAYTQPGTMNATIVVLINRYPAAKEGISDQILSSLLKVINEMPKNK